MPTHKKAKSDPAVRQGDVIAGKYRVGEAVASGGMGAIVRGRHEELGQDVAIKVLHPEMSDDDELVERFLREARVAAQIDSEHVVRVYDVGRTELGTPYMVMEYLDGIDLEALIRISGEQPIVEAVDHILQALNALIEAHAAGVVHRDLKPANLFLARRPGRTPRVKVLDFGISKLPPGGDAAPSLTSTRAMLGSPGYMSPEQIVSTRDVDERSDLWSLGVILYELLTGKQAYVGQTLGQVFAKIRETDLPPVRTLRPDVPVALDKVLRKCLQRDRAQRYANAEELRDVLAPFASLRTRTIVMADRRSHPGDLGLDAFVGFDEVPPTLSDSKAGIGDSKAGIGDSKASIGDSTVTDALGLEQRPEDGAGDDAAAAVSLDSSLSESAQTQHSQHEPAAAVTSDEAATEGVGRLTVATWAATSRRRRARGPLAALGLLACAGLAAAVWASNQSADGVVRADLSAVTGQAAASVALLHARASQDPTVVAGAPTAEPRPSDSAGVAAASSAESGPIPASAAAPSGRAPKPRHPHPPAPQPSARPIKPNPTAAPTGSAYDDLGI